MTEELKECQLCHKSFPKSNFYKRKDRNGEYNWKTSYCKSCEIKKGKETRKNNPEHYRKYKKEYTNKYYHENKDKVKIIQKRYYYNKLSPEKQIIYKQRLQKKHPEWVNLICI